MKNKLSPQLSRTVTPSVFQLSRGVLIAPLKATTLPRLNFSYLAHNKGSSRFSSQVVLRLAEKNSTHRMSIWCELRLNLPFLYKECVKKGIKTDYVSPQHTPTASPKKTEHEKALIVKEIAVCVSNTYLAKTWVMDVRPNLFHAEARGNECFCTRKSGRLAHMSPRSTGPARSCVQTRKFSPVNRVKQQFWTPGNAGLVRGLMYNHDCVDAKFS